MAVLLMLTMPARADRFLLQDGSMVEGEVVAEDDKAFTVEISAVGSSLTKRLNKAQVKTWYKPAREGQPYVLVPVIGAIGDDVTADAIRAGFKEARAAKPRYIILAIDSLGGSVSDMIDIIDTIKDTSREVEVVAYVRRACSAAAVIAMSCRQVYMLPEAAIGATVPWHPTENGPADVDAKFRSFIEATMRAANEHGQHADLLIRGMSEMDLEIYLSQIDGKPILSASGPGKVIKSKGQILSLTADEAVECGLARRTAGIADMGTQVCGGPWYEVNKRAWTATIATVALQRHRESEELRRQQLIIAQRDAYERIKPELDVIQRRLAELAARKVASDNAIADLTDKCNRELQQINYEYQQAVNIARYQSDPNAWIARAVETSNARAAAARQSLEVNAAHLRADSDSAQIEIRLLNDRQSRLLATIPTD